MENIFFVLQTMRKKMNGEQKTIINKGSRQKALQEKSYKKERSTQKNLESNKK
jgi:hypothetical protein